MTGSHEYYATRLAPSLRANQFWACGTTWWCEHMALYLSGGCFHRTNAHCNNYSAVRLSGVLTKKNLAHTFHVTTPHFASQQPLCVHVYVWDSRLEKKGAVQIERRNMTHGYRIQPTRGWSIQGSICQNR